MVDTVDKPDPSSLTTAALLREREASDAIYDAKLEAVLIRMTAMDKALERAEKYPTAIDNAITGVKELYNEKFKGVAEVLEERDKRAVSSATDAKTAVDAAFKAQNDSAAKTEKNFGDQIRQTADLLTSKTGSLETMINDAKTRLTSVESRTSITKETAGDTRALTFSVIAALAAVAGLVFGLIALMKG